MMKNILHVIGVDSAYLSSWQKNLLSSCRLVAGGPRLLRLCADLVPATVNITPLDRAVSALAAALPGGDVAVLASGDPLFFGIGRRLVREFGPDPVRVYPALSSLQLAFARFRLPWDDAEFVSLHGRKHEHVPGLLLAKAKTFVLTGGENQPHVLAEALVGYLRLIGEQSLLDSCRVFVAENLGLADERLFSGSLEETAARYFAEPNVMCLLRPSRPVAPVFGLGEELQHSRGLITKAEVRAVTLHKLRLPGRGVFWDIGAGSGSVSIEAARMNPWLTIYAVERKKEELENIKANIRQYGCYNVIPVAGNARDVLAHLPDPRRVFIGGSGGELADIIGTAAARLPVGGLLVANGVTGRTISLAPEYMAACGLSVTLTRLNFSRTDGSGEIREFNPITIIAGGKLG